MTRDPSLLPKLGQILVNQAELVEMLIQRMLEAGVGDQGELLGMLAQANDASREAAFVCRLFSRPGLRLTCHPELGGHD